MPLPADIEKAIEQIDRKIKDLVSARQSLISAFGGADSLPPSKNGTVRKAPESAEKALTFIRTHGSVTRKQIIEDGGVPRGSVGYVMKYLMNSKQVRKVKGKKYQIVTEE